jgi:hypothetical protein
MIHEQLQEFMQYVPRLHAGMLKTAAAVLSAREMLQNPHQATAVGLYLAAKALYGEDLLQWEPETLWLTLEKDKIDLTELERNKLQAAITLTTNPAFYWDNLVFQRTVHALCEEYYDSESLLECSVAHMCWAVYEAGILRGLDQETPQIPEFDEDVQQYVAVCLSRAGYALPPPPLVEFCEDNLDALFAKGSEFAELKKELKYAWAKLDKSALERTEFSEDALGIQLSRLSFCYLYVSERADAVAADLAKLGSHTKVTSF